MNCSRIQRDENDESTKKMADKNEIIRPRRTIDSNRQNTANIQFSIFNLQ